MKAIAVWKLAITTTPEAEDAVMELLQTELGEPASSYTDVETCQTTVAVYLTKRPRAFSGILASLQTGLIRIKGCGLDSGPGKISLQKIRRQDWAESWKRHFKPINIGQALLIKPSWSRQPARKGQATIVLDPGLSFGTGQHPTTGFCLGQVAARRRRGFSQSFLDVGTGSGILAIAAARLGYSPVDAFDFDSEAVRIARVNARNNRIGGRIKFWRGDVTQLPLRPARQYDLICANLISTLLISEQRRLLSRLKPGGVLVLAGILKTEFAAVSHTYEKAGLKLIASRTQKEWCSGAFTRRVD